jgi:hypothetical protein
VSQPSAISDSSVRPVDCEQVEEPMDSIALPALASCRLPWLQAGEAGATQGGEHDDQPGGHSQNASKAESTSPRATSAGAWIALVYTRWARAAPHASGGRCVGGLGGCVWSTAALGRTSGRRGGIPDDVKNHLTYRHSAVRLGGYLASIGYVSFGSSRALITASERQRAMVVASPPWRVVRAGGPRCLTCLVPSCTFSSGVCSPVSNSLSHTAV